MTLRPKNKQVVEFLDLMAQIQADNLSDAWFATMMASRDRYFNPLLNLYDNGEKLSDTVADDYSAKNYFRFFYYWSLYLYLFFYRKIFRRTDKSFLKGKNIDIYKTFIYKTSLKNGTIEDPVWGEEIGSASHQIKIFEPVGDVYAIVSQASRKRWYSPLDFISLSDFFRCIHIVLKGFVTQTKADYRIGGYHIHFICDKTLQCQQFSVIHLNSLLLAFALEKISKLCTVNKFVYPCENLTWERLALSSLKKHSPATQLVGFQHTNVSEACTNYYFLDSDIVPDKVLTTGKITKDNIERYLRNRHVKLEAAYAIRQKWKDRLPMLKKNTTKNILIALDGGNQVLNIVNLILREAHAFKDYHFILRFHPMVPYERIQAELICPIEQVPNVQLSKDSSMDEDISRSALVIYWASTVGMEAIMRGVPAVHLAIHRIFSFDPIQDLDSFHWTMRNSKELRQILNGLEQMPESEFYAQYSKAYDYCLSYLHPKVEGANVF